MDSDVLLWDTGALLGVVGLSHCVFAIHLGCSHFPSEWSHCGVWYAVHTLIPNTYRCVPFLRASVVQSTKSRLCQLCWMLIWAAIPSVSRMSHPALRFTLSVHSPTCAMSSVCFIKAIPAHLRKFVNQTCHRTIAQHCTIQEHPALTSWNTPSNFFCLQRNFS